jgi:hypothetical protein
MEMLSDEVLEWCAARSLGLLRDPSAAPSLLAHVRLQDGGMNRMAVWALGELGDSTSIAKLDTLWLELQAAHQLDSATLDSAITKIRGRVLLSTSVP